MGRAHCTEYIDLCEVYILVIAFINPKSTMETERAIMTRINELFELIQNRDATKTYTIYRGQREEEWLLLPKRVFEK